MAVKPFVTPDNERSFSALIDRAIIETGKTQAFLSAISYANLTVRECQALGLFAQDLIEDGVVADASPFIWPRPTDFRSLRLVQYNTTKTFPKYRMPGRGKNQNPDAYYYASSGNFNFWGIGIGEQLNTGIYYWAKPLIYFARLGVVTTSFPNGPYADREAYYDTLANEWKYLDDDGLSYVSTINDDDEEELRRGNASNWLTREWFDLISEGVKAKLFKQYGDARAPLSYALYKEGQRTLALTSGSEAETFNVIDE